MHARLAFRALAAVALSALTASAVMAQASAQQAPQVSVTGVIYAQYGYFDVPAAEKSTFDITRAYVNVLGRFSNGITTRLTTDINPTAAGSQLIRLKYAFAAWTPTGSSLTYKLGMIQTPFVDYEETLWDYRMQGTIAVDRNPLGGPSTMTSSDIGFGVDGHWNGERVNAQFALVNGEGYSGGIDDFRKDFEARVSFRLQPTDDNSRVGGFRATGYVGVGKATGGADRNRYLGQLSYRKTQFTVAGEYVSVKNAAITGSIISAFGVYHLTASKVSLIGRVDVVDPDKNIAGNNTTRIIGGASYQLSPNVRMLADLDRVKASGGTAINQFLIQAQFVF